MIAAVILNYRTPDDTLLAVRSAQASRRPIDEVIVIDNGGDDECRKALAPWRDSVRIIRSDGNAGFSGGCNLGIREALAAGANLVLLLNSDAVIAPDTVERLEQALTDHPGAGIAAPLVASRMEPGVVGSAGIRFSVSSGRMRHVGVGDPVEAWSAGPTQEADAVSGCALLVKRAVFEAAGLFDERYFYSFEDIEFCWRARRAGFGCLLAPSALALHEGHRSIGPASASRLYYAARNHLLLAASAAPVGRLRSVARCVSIVAFNLAYALRVPGIPVAAGLSAVLAGTADHLRGRYGPRARARPKFPLKSRSLGR